ncbi:MAG: ATP-binding cassette domain-containing protein [Acidobacteriota bacterium]
MTATSEPAIGRSSEVAAALTGVSFRYPGAQLWALQGVDLEIERNDFVVLLGPNGGGKTTLLRLLLGQLQPQAGSVQVLGGPPSQATRRIGYVPQHAQVDDGVPADVLDIVLTGRLGRASWGPWYRQQDRAAAMAALERTATAELAHRPFRGLSGGQRQRVLIARALATEAEILLLDEPTTGIDLERQREIVELLQGLNEHLPIIMVTHDSEVARSCARRTAWVCHRVNWMPN